MEKIVIGLSLSILTCLIWMSCNNLNSPVNSNWEARHPYTPSLDSLLNWCSLDASKLHRSGPDGSQQLIIYTLESEPFTGWACTTDHGDSHKYRFTEYEHGQLIWQLGYFANGQLDHDFRMKDGSSIGSERMWRENGDPYIDHFYSAPGIMHGIQLRWYADSVLAREAVFDHGILISEKLFDKQGMLLE